MSKEVRAATLVIVLVVLAVALPACSKTEQEAKGKSGATTTSIPEECSTSLRVGEEDRQDGGIASPENMSRRCAEAIFLAATQSASPEVKSLDKDRKLAFGSGLCAFGQVLKDQPDSARSYREFVSSTSATWKLPETAVNEIVTLTNQLCPDQLKPLLQLRAEGGSITVTYIAAGAAPLEVNYTGPQSEQIKASAASTPWEHNVDFPGSMELRLTVKSDRGDSRCAIRVNGNEAVTSTAGKGKSADCSISQDKVAEAARR